MRIEMAAAPKPNSAGPRTEPVTNGSFSRFLKEAGSGSPKTAEGTGKTAAAGQADNSVNAEAYQALVTEARAGTLTAGKLFQALGISQDEVMQELSDTLGIAVTPEMPFHELAALVFSFSAGQPKQPEEETLSLALSPPAAEAKTAVQKLAEAAFGLPLIAATKGVSENRLMAAIQSSVKEEPDIRGAKKTLPVFRDSGLPLKFQQIHSPAQETMKASLVQEEGSAKPVPEQSVQQPALGLLKSAANATAEGSGKEVPKSNFSQEFEKILSRAQFGQTNGTSKLMLKLFPEQLGMIRLEIVHRDGGTAIQLLATTAHGKELLDSSLQQLKQAFIHQNVAVDRIEISQALQDAGKQQREHSNPQQSGKGYSQTSEDGEQDEFKEFLLEVEE